MDGLQQDLTGSVANEDGKLKFTADYTTITATWYQGDIQLYKSADYSEATNASMELYCKTSDQQPTKVDIILQIQVEIMQRIQLVWQM